MGKKALIPIFLTLAVLLLVFQPVLMAQKIWYVDDDGPGDPRPWDSGVSDPSEDGTAAHPFDAIQEGIEAATAGDSILVAEGIYSGLGNRDIDFNGKAVTVQSACGPQDCIIDCGGTSTDYHRGFYFYSGEGPDSIVDGFTIKNGYSYPGGAILCDVGSSPIIRNNIVIRNVSSAGG